MSVVQKDRHVTLLFIPEKTTRVRRFQIPVKVLRGGAIGAGVLSLALLYVLVDYVSARRNMAELALLREKTRDQRVQLQAFAEKVDALDRQMMRLKSFDRKLRIIANLEPLPSQEQALGVGGPVVDEDGGSDGGSVPEGSVAKRVALSVDRLHQDAQVEERSMEELKEYLEDQRSILTSTPSLWPIHGWITSNFGYRIYPFTGDRKMHEGMDIASRPGTPIRAPADGVVIFAGVEGAYGKTVVVDHGYGVTTRYGHASEIWVRVGQRVRRGQRLAAVGNTGLSSGPHLHYEVRVNGVAVNPRNYLLE